MAFGKGHAAMDFANPANNIQSPIRSEQHRSNLRCKSLRFKPEIRIPKPERNPNPEARTCAH